MGARDAGHRNDARDARHRANRLDSSRVSHKLSFLVCNGGPFWSALWALAGYGSRNREGEALSIGRLGFLLLPALLVLALPCRAQEPAIPMPEIPLRLGGLTVAPGIEFKGGFDTNVFNVPEQQTRDFVWTVRPKAAAALRLGRVQLSGAGAADIVHFQRTQSERSVNVDATVSLVVPLNRVRPYVTGSFLRTRQRPGFAIDARSQRRERSESAGATIRISPLTSVQLVAARAHVAFDADAVYLGTFLSNELNRTVDTLRVLVKGQLTPLTALAVTVDKTRESFLYSPARNSAGHRATVGLELGSRAFINGRVSVGYGRLALKNSSAPEFGGVVASTELAYTLRGATRLQLHVARDTEPSYDVFAPYSVLTQVGGGITRQLSDSVGVVGRGGRYHYGYRGLAPDTSRVERVFVYGGGIVKKFGRRLRMESSVDYYRRSSPLAFRTYNGLQVNNTFVHGF
jgi:hypothetical protein